MFDLRIENFQQTTEVYKLGINILKLVYDT